MREEQIFSIAVYISFEKRANAARNSCNSENFNVRTLDAANSIVLASSMMEFETQSNPCSIFIISKIAFLTLIRYEAIFLHRVVELIPIQTHKK